MIDAVIRFFKRFAVLIPGLVGAYLVATDAYPILNRQVPAPLAVLGTYILGAYILIPGIMRIIRIFIKPNHIPHYSTTPDGLASDPVNIGVVGTRDQVIKAMTAAGWHLADKRTIGTVLKMGVAIVLRKPYLNAPFSNLYLFGRKQDLGFQLPVNDSPNSRHHVRFWSCSPLISDIEKRHISFWQRHILKEPKAERQLWLGAASLDVGLGIIMHNAQLTHAVHPDTDAERNLIVKMLSKAGRVRSKKVIKVGEAYKLRNRVFRTHLKTDGKVVILTLKP
jgi:hypothetical protein